MSDFIKYFIKKKVEEAVEMTCAVMLNILKYVPGVQGVDEAVHIGPNSLALVPDALKTERICNEVVCREPWALKFVPENLQTQEMCKRVVEENPRLLKYVPDRFKTKEICDKTVSHDPSSLQYVPDYFVTQQQVKLRNGRLIKWYNGYQKRQVQKAQIKKELIPIAWHPSRYWGWCISEAKKREAEKLWA